MADKLTVLWIDDRADDSTALTRALAGADCDVTSRGDTDQSIGDAVERTGADVIVVHAEKPTAEALACVREIEKRHARPIVMLVDCSDEASTREAVDAGVAAYVVRGAAPDRMRSIVDVAVARYRAHQALKNELNEVRTHLEERKVLDHAKGLLIRKRGATEPEAHRMLQKMAMDQNARLIDVAQRVLEMKDLL